MPASSKKFLDIQATKECGFTLKPVRDMTRTYSLSNLCLICQSYKICLIPHSFFQPTICTLIVVDVSHVTCFVFFIWVFFYEHSRITGLQGKGEGISLTPHYHFHPLHGHLDISQAITAESSPLHTGSSPTRTGNLWFPSASR